MQDEKNKRFDEAAAYLPERISGVLLKLPVFVKSACYEIRLRAGCPLVLTGVKDFFVGEDASVSTLLPTAPVVPKADELEEALMKMADRSLYNRENELCHGFLTLKNGCRVGVGGVFSFGRFSRATSLNIRIAREIKGCAGALSELADAGLLIAGPPGSGKTTLLRDLIRTLSNGGKKVCVVDSREEICGISDCGAALDVGINTDVISGVPKAQGVEMALRTMFPDYIAFDEVGSGRELELISESFFSGVAILTTAHARDEKDLLRRPVTARLLDGCVSNVVLLSPEPGSKYRIIPPEEVRRLA